MTHIVPFPSLGLRFSLLPTTNSHTLSKINLQSSTQVRVSVIGNSSVPAAQSVSGLLGYRGKSEVACLVTGSWVSEARMSENHTPAPWSMSSCSGGKRAIPRRGSVRRTYGVEDAPTFQMRWCRLLLRGHVLSAVRASPASCRP